MKKNILITILLLTVTYPAIAQTKLNLIPQPNRVEPKDGTFQIDQNTVIYYDDDACKMVANYLSDEIVKKTGLTLSTKTVEDASNFTKRPQNAIVFAYGKFGSDRHALNINPDFVNAQFYAPEGAFYAAVSILQLIDAKTHTIPCVVIFDEPRFKWRGLMLDCSRTFQSIDYIKKTIDLMAMYKMNILHLHLTDDQGWRIEIKKYPELTAKGATFPAKYNEPKGNGGFYTQKQMKDIIKYAAERFITIVPEIELPGHSIAALACYPELSCTGGPFEIYPFFKGPNITPDIFCAGNEQTFTFFQNVLDEVFEIFPSEIVHIGGDEAPKSRWQKCPKCQKRIVDNNLKDEHELQSYFIKRIEKYANSKGKRIIGWDEILEGGLAPNAAVMSWRGISGGIAAASSGHDVVMSPTSHCYFDYTYDAISTERAYSFEPIPEDLPKDKHKHILGLQANFWSHIDRTPDLVDRQLWPRLIAIAERGWSPKETRDFDDFNRRLKANLNTLKHHNVAYKREVTRQLVGQWSPDTVTEEYAPITFDATTQITKSGDYRLQLQYTTGACRLGIEKVELLEDGQTVSYDTHRGVTGASHDANIYTLKLPTHNANSKYQIRATVRSEGGKESNGKIFFISEVNNDKL